MRSTSRTRTNIWRLRQNSLGSPTRRKPPASDYVFYAPLWHSDLNTSPFLSKDSNTFSCAVTGATWGTKGRTFDGSDDQIVATTGSSLPSGSTARTVLIWAKPTVFVAQARGLVSWGEYLESKFFCINHDNGTGILALVTHTYNFTSTLTMVAGKWHYIVAELSGTNVALELDGTRQTGTLGATPNTTSSSLYIGSKIGMDNSFFNTVIGEVLVYSRLLTTAEKSSYRLSTIWRYS